jgi:hypothetical protein
MTTIPFAERPSCTIEEACQATGLGRTKLYEEMAAGRVQTTYVGRRRLVLVPSLLRLLTLDGVDQSASSASHAG